jgi:hypothetical protein
MKAKKGLFCRKNAFEDRDYRALKATFSSFSLPPYYYPHAFFAQLSENCTRTKIASSSKSWKIKKP